MNHLDDPYGIWFEDEPMNQPNGKSPGRGTACNPGGRPIASTSDYNRCPLCHAKMQVIEFGLQCSYCGMIIKKNLCSGEFEYRPDIKRSSALSYKHMDHYKTWITCILAREKITKELESVLADMPSNGSAVDVWIYTIKAVRSELSKKKTLFLTKMHP